MPEKQGYETALAAIAAAMKEAVPLSERHEYAGVIYEMDDRFYYTNPKSAGETHSVKVKVRYPKGAKLHGLYHTHPEGPHSEVFSPGDIEVARQLGLPYYMGHFEDGNYSVFVPGKTPVSRVGFKDKRLASDGLRLGNVFDDGKEDLAGTMQ